MKAIVFFKSIAEVYNYVNGPKLFLSKCYCKNFLCYWCDYKDDSEGYLCLEVSKDRIKNLKSKNITLHQAFKNPETNAVYKLIYLSVNEASDIINDFDFNNNTDLLPPDDIFIEYTDKIKKR